MVRLTGIEPVRPYGHKILSLGRLPIPPQSLGSSIRALSQYILGPSQEPIQNFAAVRVQCQVILYRKLNAVRIGNQQATVCINPAYILIAT